MSKETPGDLANLAMKYGFDKWGHHHYCNHYDRHLSGMKGLREKSFTLIELGIGGYHYPERGGAGLRMWHDFFPKAKIVGIDIHPKNKIQKRDRTFIFQGSQDDEAFLSYVINETGRPTVVIDDASHMNLLTIKSFEILWPKLEPGGIYIVEDIESSWWEEQGFDGCRDINNREVLTTINYFRSLLNKVNAKTTAIADEDIESIHFYENMIIVHKRA